MNTSDDQRLYASLKVLLIDDEISIVQLLTSMLHQLGIVTVFGTRDSSKAIELFQKHYVHIDVVLCDWNMPSHSGLDLLRLFRGLKPSIDFIMVTGSAQLAQVQEAKANGVSAYIKKPFGADDISKKLAALARIKAAREKRAVLAHLSSS